MDALSLREVVATTISLSLIAVCDDLRPVIILRIIMRTFLILILINNLITYRKSFISNMMYRRRRSCLNTVHLLNLNTKLLACADFTLVKSKTVIENWSRCISIDVVQRPHLLDVLLILHVAGYVFLNPKLLLISRRLMLALYFLLQEVAHMHKCIDLVLYLSISVILVVALIIVVI